MAKRLPQTTGIGEEGASRPARRRDDPLGLIARGRAEPDEVLVEIRLPEGRSYGAAKAYHDLIERLERDPDDPLDPLQVLAARTYGALLEAMTAVGSNTDAAIERLKAAKCVVTKEDRELKAWGRMMRAVQDAPPVRDPSGKWIAAVDAVRRVDARLNRLEVAILRDVIERGLVVTQLSRRWGRDHRALTFFLRAALWSLVDALEKADADFSELAGAEREIMLDMARDRG